jgi:hypothetical protein
MGKRESSKLNSTIYKLFSYVHNHVQAINNSKIFAGLMIITLNIVSKFVNIKLSKTMEAYLKFTFSRQILVFAIAWMGTRDIYIALLITILFVILTEHLFHEESMFFVFPEEFRDRHIEMLENEGNDKTITEEDVRKATEVLEKAKKQNKMPLEYQSFAMK